MLAPYFMVAIKIILNSHSLSKSLFATKTHTTVVMFDASLERYAGTPPHRSVSKILTKFVKNYARNQSLASSGLREKFNPYFPSYLVGSNRSAKTGIYTIQAPRTWVADALTKVAAFAHQDILSHLLKQYDAQLLRAPQ